MKLTGRCYCGDIQYEIDGEAQASLHCHCRECQYISGGNPAALMIFPLEAFCLTQVFTPAVAIFTCDKQAFHHIPEDIPTFEKRPG